MSTKVTTGKRTRLSYAHVHKPYAFNPGDPETYSCCVLIPKDDTQTVNKIKAALNEAKEQGKASKWGGKIPAGLFDPFRDGDAERPDDSAYKGHYFLNAKGYDRKPKIYDKHGNEMIGEEEEVYSGCYAKVILQFRPFANNGKKGISCILGNIMKVADGEPLGTDLDFSEDDFEDDDDFLD